MNNIFFISLGCAKNLVDSENIIEKAENAGFDIVYDINNADIIIINTCGFIKDAKEESISEIFKVIDVKKKSKIKVIVVGCLVERYLRELEKEIPEVDYFLGVNSEDKIIDILIKLSGKKENKKICSHRKSLHSSYLKISEGCSNRCSYCSIPDIRGSYKSRSKEDVFMDLKKLLQKGAKEINLIAQDTTLYGKDIYDNYYLYDLMKDISDNKQVEWLRLLYTHPKHLSSDVISLINERDNICQYIDLPLQHINDNILKRMGRGVSKKDIINLIENIKKYNIAIRTSFIIGFPGEGEKEFQELLDFVKEVKFERLGVFKYSQEEGTPAFNFKQQVEEKVMDERFHKLMTEQQYISEQYNKDLQGKDLNIIIDGVSEFDENIFIGRSKIDAPDVDGIVFIEKKDNVNIGDIVKVKITDTYEYDLKGYIL